MVRLQRMREQHYLHELLVVARSAGFVTPTNPFRFNKVVGSWTIDGYMCIHSEKKGLCAQQLSGQIQTARLINTAC